MYEPRLNPLHEIVAVGLALGAVIGAASTALVVCYVKNSGEYVPAIVAYGLVHPYYFLNEFLMTYWYQQQRVHSRSFLIYGNRGNFEFWLMQIATVCELLAAKKGWIWSFQSRAAGSVLVVVGLALRSLAMKTCGASFSHIIETSAGPGHQLVTHGVYAWIRHPSYTGFCLYVVGLQVFLGNWLCLAASILVLRKFFSTRISYEEWFLVKMYGEQYETYRSRVAGLIPYVY